MSDNRIASGRIESAARIQTYAEFWPFYLREHARPVTRAWHYLGTSIGLACLVTAIATGNLYWLLGGLVSGYGPAWVGHFFFEKNKPASFRYPLWSFVSDFRMYFAFLGGSLGRELAKAGVAAPATDAAAARQ
ncbi:MAG: Mpo1-like protein [Ferrovibrio sp.]|uniref:Mpo1-like protein n=1 Tax=Ferrovibrio sp. TaxID=1917215 RepID=UPI00391B6F22